MDNLGFLIFYGQEVNFSDVGQIMFIGCRQQYFQVCYIISMIFVLIVDGEEVGMCICWDEDVYYEFGVKRLEGCNFIFVCLMVCGELKVVYENEIEVEQLFF